MIIRDIIFSAVPPNSHNTLWIKAEDNNINTIYVHDGIWRKIGTSSGGGTSDYNDLLNKPKINNIILEGNLSLKDLGILLPNISNYVTKEALKLALKDYAKKSDIPSIEGLLSKNTAEDTYQKKGDYALKSDIPNTDSFATKTELSQAISNQTFKTINGQEITGVGDIQIEGSSIEVDDFLSDTSVNPVENKVITDKINQLEELLQKLDNKIFPTTLTVSGGGTYDEGTTQVVTVTWKLMKDGKVLTPDSVTINNEEVDPSVNYKVFTGVTSTTVYRVNVVYNGKEFTGSTVATFKKTYYRYYGAIPLDVTFDSITSDTITALTKEVCTGAGASNLSFPIPEEGRLTYAYPSRLGQLSQVQDMNLGGAPSTDWSTNGDVTTPNPRATITINNESYYVYCSINPNYEGTFKLSFIK